MTELIPAFDWQQHVVAPWSTGLRPTLWIVLMGFFVATACGLIGNYLILRRMALVGDAISHSVLAGIGVVVTLPFLVEHLPVLNWIGLGNVSGELTTTALFIGALGAGVITTLIIEVIHRYSRVKQDAAIGITFTSLFAIGVILIKVKSGNVHIDTECVLYGEIVNLPHQPPRIEIAPALSGIVDNMPLFHVFLHGNELEMAPGMRLVLLNDAGNRSEELIGFVQEHSPKHTAPFMNMVLGELEDGAGPGGLREDVVLMTLKRS